VGPRATQDRPVDRAPADWLRASSWIIAFGVGLGAGFSVYGTGQGVAAAAVSGFQWFGLTLAGVFGLPMLLWLLNAVVDFSDRLRDYRGEAEPTTPTPTPPSPLVAGALLDEYERYVQDGLLLTLAHARRANSLTVSALVPAAFSDRSAWVWWTDVLASSRLVDKANGVPTALPPGRTWTWAIRQVRNGYFEVPDARPDAPLPPQPAPLPGM
jgi:hypothetical protein